MISISENKRYEQIKKLDAIIMKAVELGQKHYDFLLKWKLDHLKTIKNKNN